MLHYHRVIRMQYTECRIKLREWYLLLTTSPAEPSQTWSQKQYENVVKVGWEKTLGVCILNWALFAGYLVFPGAIPKIESSTTVHKLPGGDKILHTVQNLPLLIEASVVFCQSAIGIGRFGWHWRDNIFAIQRRIVKHGT